MAKTYTTQQGDAWDAIAHKVYGSETYTGWLMQNNLPLLDIFVFEAGTVLQTPDPPEVTRRKICQSGGREHENTQRGGGSDLERRGSQK